MERAAWSGRTPRGGQPVALSPTYRAYRNRSQRSIAPGAGQNLIKAHKLHLASDRTSCHKATGNQFRLLIHTAAYWLMLSLAAWHRATPSGAMPSSTRSDVPDQGRRPVTEMVTRIKVALPACFPLPDRLCHARGPNRQAAAVGNGAVAPDRTLGSTSNLEFTASPTPPKTTAPVPLPEPRLRPSRE